MAEGYVTSLVAFRLKEINVTTDFEKPVELSLSFECQAEIKPPHNEDDPTVMLEIEFKTVDNNGKLNVTGTAQSIFKFDPIPTPEKRQDIIVSKCLGEATAKIADSMGHVLEAMGLGITVTSAKN